MSIFASSLIARVSAEGVETTEHQLESVGRKSDETKSHFDQLKGALSFAAGQALFTGISDGFGFLKDQLGQAFQQSMDAQAGMADTVNVLRSTNDASGMTAQGIADLATQYSHLTKFQDDTVQSGENMLLTFTNIGKKTFPDATVSMLDLAQKMGGDVKGAAIQLGKALNDPLTGITALTRVGVTFDDQQKKLIKTYMDHGDIAHAQGVILKELQKEFGGAAEAAGKTFGGQLAILGQNLDDIRQAIGDALLPYAQKFVSWISATALPALSHFGDWFVKNGVPALQSLAQTVEKNVLPGVLKFSDWFVKTGAPAVKELADTVIKNLLPPLGNLITNVVTLGIHISEWLQNSGLLQDAIATVSGVLGTLVGWVATFVGWLDQGNPLAWILVGAIGGIALAIEGVKLADWIYGWKSLGDTFKDLAQNLMPNYTASLKTTTKAAGETKDSVKAIATETTTTREVVATETAVMEGDIAAVGTAAEVTAGEEGVGAIGAAASNAEGEVGAAATGMTGAFAGIAGSLGIGLVIAAIGLVITKLPDMAQALDDVANTMIAKAPDVETAFNTTFQKTKGDIISAMEAASTQVNIDQKGMADEAEKQAKRMDDAWSHASQDMNIHDLLAASGWTPAQIAKYTGSTPYSDMPNPTVHRHAAGTSFAPGGLSLLGEGKEPEIVMGPTLGNLTRGSQVIPFSQLRGGGGGGGYSGPQEIHIHMNVAGNRVVDAVLPDLAQALRHGLGTIGL